MHRLHTLTLESTLFCCKPDEATLRLGLKSRAGCNRAEAANERWKPEYSLSHSVWTEHQSPAESREKANVYFYFARFYFCPVYNSAQARWLNHHLLACGSFATLRAITSLNALFLRPCDLLSGLWMTFLRCWARNKIEKKTDHWRRSTLKICLSGEDASFHLKPSRVAAHHRFKKFFFKKQEKALKAFVCIRKLLFPAEIRENQSYGTKQNK